MREPDSSPSGILTLSTEGMDADLDTPSMEYMHKYDRAVSMGELEQNLNIGMTPTRGGPSSGGIGAPKTPSKGSRSRSEGVERPMTPGHQRLEQWQRPRPTPWPKVPHNMNSAEAICTTETDAETDMDTEVAQARPNNDDGEPDTTLLLDSEAEYWTAT